MWSKTQVAPSARPWYKEAGYYKNITSAQRRVWTGAEKPKFTKGTITMTLRINDVAPDFEAETTQGRIRFHEFVGDSWCVLFSHPKDFTPVCTTELGYMAGLKSEFEK